MAGTKPDGGLQRTGAPARRAGLVRVDWSASRRANSLFPQPGLEFGQWVAEEVIGFGCGRESGIEVHEREPTPSLSESFWRLKTRSAVAPRTARAKADGSGTGVIWKENVAFISEVNWGRNWFRFELSNI